MRVIGRLLLAFVLAVTFTVGTMGVGQASSPMRGPRPVPGPDVSTQAAVEAYVAAHPLTTAEIVAGKELQANVHFTKDGFATTDPKFIGQVKEINAGMAQFRASVADPLVAQGSSNQHATQPLIGAVQAQAGWWCIYLPGWWFRATEAMMILEAGFFGSIAPFVAGTIAGIPVAAVLGVVGIWVGVEAWVLDRIFDWRGYYSHGLWVCL